MLNSGVLKNVASMPTYLFISGQKMTILRSAFLLDFLYEELNNGRETKRTNRTKAFWRATNHIDVIILVRVHRLMDNVTPSNL